MRNSKFPILNFKFRAARGMALVIVLAFLVLLTGLSIAFFSLMTGETTQSSTYAYQVQGQQLADSVMNLVTGQFAEATKGFKTNPDGTPDYNSPLAWASQPGAIRTFGANGTADNVFKLYSANRLVATASEFTSDLGTDAPNDWASKPALFTDLNAPVNDAGGNAVYPIVDPRSYGSVEGFSFAGAPTTGTSNTLPMPAQWLYVLRDGTIISPSGGTGTGGNFTGTVPSAANPIVGRVAYWTDDETAKVNINTASEGTLWDTPRADSVEERTFGNSQPVKNEFQRYPGHPATTSLAPVLFATSSTSTPNPLTKTQRDAIYEISPRVAGGGSDAGSTPTNQAGLQIITIPNRRIYSHVDEMIFNDSRSAQVAAAGLSREKLEQSRFFLTANSRAPETTLFNTPRIAVWPLSSTDDTTHRTAYDSLIARCGSIGPIGDPAHPNYPFYFMRSDPSSGTVDFSGAPTASSTLTGLNRNRNLYAYLQNLTARQIPGFGGSFLTKYSYPNERDQILTEIFDYIRTTNLEDKSTSTPGFQQYASDIGTNGSGPGNLVRPILIGATQPVTPQNGTQGMGRFPVLSEFALHFIANADGSAGTTASPIGGNSADELAKRQSNTMSLASTQRQIQAMPLLELFNSGMGWPQIRNLAYTIRIRGLENLTVTTGNSTQNLFPVSTATAALNRSEPAIGMGYRFWGWRPWGGTVSPRMVAADSSVWGTETFGNYYPFVGSPVIADASSGNMTLKGGNVTVDVFWGNSANVTTDVPVSTQVINIPGSTIIPIPTLRITAIEGKPNSEWWSFNSRISRFTYIISDTYWDNAVHPVKDRLRYGAGFLPEDVVRSMVPAHSDFRLSLGGKMPAFVPFSGAGTSQTASAWSPTAPNVVHAFSEPWASDVNVGESFTPLAASTGVTYAFINTPDVAIRDPNTDTGDWDNAPGKALDGAYTNKADEGNLMRVGWGYGGGIPYFETDNRYHTSVGETFFSPNRQIPSAAMFGSLPTGAKEGVPYRTLLFRPQPGHPSSWKDVSGTQKSGIAGKTPDHLILDLFWMPVVEPYAISEPFSTAGKINMNYSIAPYSYIQRKTGLVAALRPEKVFAIPNTDAVRYKFFDADPPGGRVNSFRSPISATETLKQFDAKFAGGEIFKSASEICDIHLIPSTVPSTTINLSGNTTNADSVMVTGSNNFWSKNQLAGDNTRERPYANLLGRLTTKSNTFTIHYKVQALRQRTNTPDFATWEDGKDQVLAEYRGSTMIERYIDPNDTRLPDFATKLPAAPGNFDDTTNIDNYYRIRTVSTKRFAP